MMETADSLVEWVASRIRLVAVSVIDYLVTGILWLFWVFV